MSTFECSIEEFKLGVSEFTKAAPNLDDEQLENGFKAVGLMYLGITPATELNLMIAKSYLDYAARRHLEAELALMGTNV